MQKICINLLILITWADDVIVTILGLLSLCSSDYTICIRCLIVPNLVIERFTLIVLRVQHSHPSQEVLVLILEPHLVCVLTEPARDKPVTLELPLVAHSELSSYWLYNLLFLFFQICLVFGLVLLLFLLLVVSILGYAKLFLLGVTVGDVTHRFVRIIYSGVFEGHLRLGKVLPLVQI